MTSESDRNHSVFINCPYDQDYQPILDAVVLATVCCGFMPRCAIGSSHISEPRIHNIVNMLKNSKYSIHDLSRCHGEGDANLARFNMPLELGMAIYARFAQPGVDSHDWLALAPKGHIHVKYVSDLAGFDPMQVDSTPEAVVRVVMSWLVTRHPDAPPVRSDPSTVLQALPLFSQRLKKLREEWGGMSHGRMS
jgi:hypothetical protein